MWLVVHSPAYLPKSPARGVLYQVVRDHFEAFRSEAARIHEPEGLPRFIEEEFRGFLRCGFLAGGFARLHCGACRLDRLVPFSCKGRAVCPSCGGRRMAERAAHLVDQAFPDVPVRQWVLSLPHRLRYLLAWDHARCMGDDLGESGGADSWLEAEPVLANIAAASVEGRRALGERAGAKPVRRGAWDELPAFVSSGLGPCHARWRGYDLHAIVCVPAWDLLKPR